jgi:hypothetical protein
MNAKSNSTRSKWVDPDDAPELTQDFFDNATPMIGERIVTEKEFVKAAERVIRKGKSRLFTDTEAAEDDAEQVVGREGAGDA